LRTPLLTLPFFKTIRKYNHFNWALIDQAMVSGVNFLTGILFARFLGIEEFGRFTLVWMVVLFVNSVQMAIISTPMMSIAPKQRKKDLPAYYGAVTVQQISFATLSSIIVWGGVKISDLYYPDWAIGHLALPLASVVFSFQNQDFLRRLFYTYGKHSFAFFNDMISYLGQLFLIILIYKFYYLNISVVLWIISATSLLAVFMGYIMVHGHIKFCMNFGDILTRHWRSSKWMLASVLLQWLTGNLFYIFTGTILGTAAVGALKAAQNILSLSNLFLVALDNVVPVRSSMQLFKTGQTAMLNYLKKVLLFTSIPVITISLIGLLWPVYCLKIFYGDQFLGYGYVVQWYAVISLLFLLSFPLRTALRSLEYILPIFFADVAKVVFTLLFAKKLIVSFKLTGVMIGLFTTHIISFSILTILLIFYSKKLRANSKRINDDQKRGL